MCWLHGVCEGGIGGVCAGCMVCVRVMWLMDEVKFVLVVRVGLFMVNLHTWSEVIYKD